MRMRTWNYLLLMVPAVALGCVPDMPSGPRSSGGEVGVTVTSVEQAVVLVRRFEKQLYDELYGPDQPQPALASEQEPYSVIEDMADGEPFYAFEFRKPFGLAGGGYIKTFHVNRRTGEVTRGAWQLGR